MKLSKARTAENVGTEAKTGRFGCNSWIIVSRETGKAVLETWQASVVAKVNTAKYEVFTAHEWLVRVNHLIRHAADFPNVYSTALMRYRQ